MGRSPCCDKVGLKKGPWTPEEDQKLLAYIEEHGHGHWRALPAKAGLRRCGKSCRLRWTNYLRPDIKRGKFSLQEDQTIIQLHALLGNRWAAIATHLPKRTDNEIKNYWNTHLKKRLTKMGIDPVTHKPQNDTLLSDDGQNKNAANLSHMAQWESARLEAEARLVRQSKLRQAQTQAQNNDQFETNSSPSNKPVGPALSWNGGVSVQSPTSTLSSNAGVGGYGEPIRVRSEWMSDSGGVNNSCEQVSVGNFVENFTDLLFSATSGERTLSEDGGRDTNNGGSGSSGGDGGGGCYEDNKNYWNNILNLVNSSPSHSPLF